MAKRQFPARVEGAINKKRRIELIYSKCVFCQEKTEEKTVKQPKSYKTLLDTLRIRSEHGNTVYGELHEVLSDEDESSLRQKGATWHRSCYQSLIRKRDIEYERKKCKPNDEREEEALNKSFTRSSSSPFNKDLCFFCQTKGTKRHPLHKVATDAAGQNLHNAVIKGDNDALKVRLSEALDPNDAHAIDVLYHSRCWGINVRNILRSTSKSSSDTNVSEVAAEIEFLSLIRRILSTGEILSMAEIENTFKAIRISNCVSNPDISRKTIKTIIQENIEGVVFSRQKSVTESERVALEETRDRVLAEEDDRRQNASKEETLADLYSSAYRLRKLILSTVPWTFKGTETLMADAIEESIPRELYCFFRWLIAGTHNECDKNIKSNLISQKVLNLAQTTMFSCLSPRQIKHKSTEGGIRHTREFPLQLAVGIAVHQTCRSRKLIELLNSLSISLDYKRILQLENQIGNQVILNMTTNGGIYIPDSIVRDRHVFFAVDNCDFSEDTPDGKSTLHGTVMAVYQRNDTIVTRDNSFTLDHTIDGSKLHPLPNSMTTMIPCFVPKPFRPVSPIYQGINNDRNRISVWQQEELLQDFVWVAATASTIRDQEDASGQLYIPSWKAFHSCIRTEALPITYVRTPPIIPAPAHEWSTLLTVLKQAQGIKSQIIGNEKATVISLDMGLYKPAMQLKQHREDLSNLVLRPGELHIMMAMLRTIGSFIENSGVDGCWLEAGLYSRATVKQILDGGHIKRALHAHTISLLALVGMFLEVHNRREIIITCSDNLNEAFRTSRDSRKLANAKIEATETLKNSFVVEDLGELSKNPEIHPMASALIIYMDMVFTMLLFIRAVHTGDWELHLETLTHFQSFFFALDRINYARMIPLYIAQMKEIEQTNPELHEEFKKGNWVVNRNDIPFCCIGADNALEHVNRQMKVSGGIIGITQNEAARSRFFLVSPELSKISEEAFKMCGQKSSVSEKHHEDNLPVTRRMEASTKSLLSVLRRCGNPFGEESTDVLNIITKEIMPNVIKTDILRVLQVGEELSQNFIEERIQSNMVNLWAPMKKAKLQLWRNNIKNSKLSIKEKACELKEDRGLFARILIAARSRPEINLQEIISSYELSAVPRSMFSTDGSLLPVSAKSQLLHILEELVSSTNVKGPASDLESSTVAQQEVSAALMPSDDPATTAETSLFSDRQQRVAVIDAMSDVQCLSKPHWVKTCKDLGTHFVETMKRKYILPNQFDEVHFIFDRYDVALSLKTETRHKRLGNRVAVQYRIDDETNITNVPMKKLLSHSKTKDELSTYLARSLLNMSYNLDITVVCAWRNEAKSNILDVSDLSSCHEEADTKIILHSLHASRRGFSNLSIFSHDTDVLVLALRRYHLLPRESIFCTGTGIHHREIRLDRISDTLTTLQANALPGFHALSGCDITGSFAGKGKRSFWKVFIKCDDDVLQAIARLGTEDLQTETKKLLEKFICMVYKPDTDESDIGKLRWDMFKQHQNESERLPPTKSALEEALKRANYQCLIWNSDEIALPAIPEPEGHGWVKKNNRYVPVMSSIPPAPEAAMNLVKCNCIKSNCSSKCRCRANGLTCTELCGCGSDDAKCTNTIIQSLFATHLTNENEP